MNEASDMAEMRVPLYRYSIHLHVDGDLAVAHPVCYCSVPMSEPPRLVRADMESILLRTYGPGQAKISIESVLRPFDPIPTPDWILHGYEYAAGQSMQIAGHST